MLDGTERIVTIHESDLLQVKDLRSLLAFLRNHLGWLMPEDLSDATVTVPDITSQGIVHELEPVTPDEHFALFIVEFFNAVDNKKAKATARRILDQLRTDNRYQARPISSAVVICAGPTYGQLLISNCRDVRDLEAPDFETWDRAAILAHIHLRDTFLPALSFAQVSSFAGPPKRPVPQSPRKPSRRPKPTAPAGPPGIEIEVDCSEGICVRVPKGLFDPAADPAQGVFQDHRNRVFIPIRLSEPLRIFHPAGRREIRPQRVELPSLRETAHSVYEATTKASGAYAPHRETSNNNPFTVTFVKEGAVWRSLDEIYHRDMEGVNE